MNSPFPAALLGGVATVFFFTGRSTVFLKDGNAILGTDTGSIDLPPGAGGFASLITFDQNGGQIRLRGEFNPAEGKTSGDYNGSICN